MLYYHVMQLFIADTLPMLDLPPCITYEKFHLPLLSGYCKIEDCQDTYLQHNCFYMTATFLTGMARGLILIVFNRVISLDEHLKDLCAE
jgi:hypothetical protein